MFSSMFTLAANKNATQGKIEGQKRKNLNIPHKSTQSKDKSTPFIRYYSLIFNNLERTISVFHPKNI